MRELGIVAARPSISCFRQSGTSAAKRFFRKALAQPHTVNSRTITVDKNPASESSLGDEGRRQTVELRPYLDCFVRGSGGVSAMEQVKLMKLLWDGVGSEFGERHELYKVNYAGSHEEIRRYALFGAIASGDADRWKGFAERCMADRWLQVSCAT